MHHNTVTKDLQNAKIFTRPFNESDNFKQLSFHKTVEVGLHSEKNLSASAVSEPNAFTPSNRKHTDIGLPDTCITKEEH